MPDITAFAGVRYVRAIGDANVAMDDIFNHALAWLAPGDSYISAVLIYEGNEKAAKLHYFTPTGQAPAGLPSTDDPELATRLAKMSLCTDGDEHWQEDCDPAGCLQILDEAYFARGARIYRVDDMRGDVPRLFHLDLGAPMSGLRLRPGTVYHYGTDGFDRGGRTLESFQQVAELVHAPDATVFDGQNWPEDLGDWTGKLFVWDFANSPVAVRI